MTCQLHCSSTMITTVIIQRMQLEMVQKEYRRGCLPIVEYPRTLGCPMGEDSVVGGLWQDSVFQEHGEMTDEVAGLAKEGD